MSKFLRFTKINSRYRRRQWPYQKLGFTSVTTLMIILVFFLSIIYFTQINNTTTKGYEIRTLETKVSELKEINQKLELQAIELKSLNNVQERLLELKMSKVVRVDYLKEPGAVVAVK